ncbi:MAG: 50S ribosomal protein L10 [Dehalococcoidia bacterium]|nr:50S ribosomal protein L10 [Dehalococcoidia bacterium]
MPTEKKVATVAELTEVLSKNDAIVATDYRGLTVADVTGLRKKLREEGAQYLVVKNTLVRLAGQKVGKEGLSNVLQGPTALALSDKDASRMAKALLDYMRVSTTKFTVKGGMLGKRVLSVQDVSTLATLPSRDILISRLLGQMNAPIANLVSVLDAPIRGLAIVLKGRLEKLESAK